MEAYKQALQNVKLWGPTNAAPIINHVARFAEQAAAQPNAQVCGRGWDCRGGAGFVGGANVLY